MKIYRIAVLCLIFGMTLKSGSATEIGPEDVNDRLRQYGLSEEPRNFILSSRERCSDPKDGNLHRLRFKKYFELSQGIVKFANTHFDERLTQHNEERQKIYHHVVSDSILVPQYGTFTGEIALPVDPLDYPQETNITSAEEKFSLSKMSFEISLIYAEYIYGIYKGIKSLKAQGIPETSQPIINLKKEIKTETFFCTMLLALTQDTIKELQGQYAVRISSSFDHDHLNYNVNKAMGGMRLDDVKEKLDSSAHKNEQSSEKIKELLDLYEKVFREPNGPAESWGQSLWRSYAYFTQSSRDDLLEKNFYPLLTVSSLDHAVKTLSETLWTFTFYKQKKKVTSGFHDYFKPLCDICFSSTGAFMGLIPANYNTYQKPPEKILGILTEKMDETDKIQMNSTMVERKENPNLK